MRYALKRLEAAEDLAAFKDGYERNLADRSNQELALKLPLDYLSTSVVMGVLDAQGGVIGGFVMRYAPPFRCLDAVPAAEKATWLQAVPEAAQCELTCIWRHRSLPTTRFATWVWPRIIAACVRSGRHYILGLGFDNRMNETYQVCSPRTVYRGPSAATETATAVHIFAFTRPRIVANFVTNFLVQVPQKLLRARR